MRDFFHLIYLGFLFTILSYNCASHQPFVYDSSSLHLNLVESKHNIPSGLLAAISKVESGRYHQTHKKIISWPWVIHAEGQGHFFSSKQEAINAVKDLKKKGIKNIDVGLMQINLHYHPNAFSSLEQAFDPKTNIEYAAKFLKNLKNEHSSWSKAVAHYHSAIPEHHIPYRKKVFETWQQEKRNMFTMWSSGSQVDQTLNSSPVLSNTAFKLIRGHSSYPSVNNSKHIFKSNPQNIQKYQRKFNPSFKPRLIKLTKGGEGQNKNKLFPLKNNFRLIRLKN